MDEFGRLQMLLYFIGQKTKNLLLKICYLLYIYPHAIDMQIKLAPWKFVIENLLVCNRLH
jgi:hypothetical protein